MTHIGRSALSLLKCPIGFALSEPQLFLKADKGDFQPIDGIFNSSSYHFSALRMMSKVTVWSSVDVSTGEGHCYVVVILDQQV